MKQLLFLAFAFVCSNVFAQTDTLFKSSVQDVMNLPVAEKEEETVTTASKKAESALAAPAAMTVITEKEIEAFGALNLHEILDRVTSIFARGSYTISESSVIMRGTISTLSSHTLILLNGRPIRDIYGGIGSLYSVFPVQSIEKMEIIRGSGSVLYGSNAYTSIVNIITKKAQENLQINSSVRYGSFETWNPTLNVSKKIKDFSIEFYGNYFKTKGWNFSARGENDMGFKDGKEIALREANSTPMQKDGYATLLRTQYKGLNISYLRTKNTYRTMNSQLPVWSPYFNDTQDIMDYIDANYQYNFSKLSLQANFSYNQSIRNTFADSSANYFFNKSVGKSYISELYAQYDFSPKLHTSVGFVWNYLSAFIDVAGRGANGLPFDWVNKPNPSFFVSNDGKENWYSLYFQTDYQIFNFLKMDIGGQINKAGDSKINFVPRINLVANWQEKIYAKLMYGQAFRSPNMFERYQNLNVIHSDFPTPIGGGASIFPETISTIEAQLIYKNPKFQLMFGYFNSHQSNILGFSSPADSLVIANAGEVGKKLASPKVINQGKLFSEGIEVEAKMTAFKNIYFTSSFSGFQVEQKARFFPTTMFKMGLIYELPKAALQMGLYSSFFGKTDFNSFFKTANPSADAFHYTTFHVSWYPKRMYEGAKNKGSVILNFYVNNALNESIYYTEYVRRVINSMPGRAGRAVYVSLQYSFGK